MSEVKTRLLELIQAKAGDRVLDIGCGIGHDVAALDALGCIGIGIDPSRKLLDIGRSRWGGAALLQGDGRCLPFATASFDACRVERVLQHVDDPTRVVEEIMRVVRPDGRVAFWEPDWQGMYFDADDDEVSRAVADGAAARVANGRIGRELERRLLEAGFVDVQSAPDVGRWTAMRKMRETWAFDTVVERVRASATIAPDRVDGWLRQLEERDAAGTFRGGFVRTYVWGRTPSV